MPTLSEDGMLLFGSRTSIIEFRMPEQGGDAKPY
jgi:hypothetical protein